MSGMPLGRPRYTRRQAGGETKHPLLTAVMVTGKGADRNPMARQAVRSFLGQSYPNKELLVVNDGPEALGIGHELVRELRVEPGRYRLGGLRNLALSEARGDWVIQWDDDDWHHPERAALQMSSRRRGAAVALRWQIRHSLPSNTSFYAEVPSGIWGTVLHERGVRFRYPESDRSEDYAFYGRFPRRVVVENPPGHQVGPAAYVRFYHGGNTWDEAHIMKEYAGRSGVTVLRPEDALLVASLRVGYCGPAVLAPPPACPS